jgi:hypothetical protein
LRPSSCTSGLTQREAPPPLNVMLVVSLLPKKFILHYYLEVTIVNYDGLHMTVLNKLIYKGQYIVIRN